MLNADMIGKYDPILQANNKIRVTISLTHICLMDFPILINWTSPFFIQEV